VLIYILLTDRTPFNSTSNRVTRQLRDEILAADYSFDAFPNVSHLGKDLVGRMLQVNRDDRISISDVLEHGWITNIGAGSAPTRPDDNDGNDDDSDRNDPSRNAFDGFEKALLAQRFSVDDAGDSNPALQSPVNVGSKRVRGEETDI